MTELRYRWVGNDPVSTGRAEQRGWSRLPRADWPAGVEMPKGFDQDAEAFWLYGKPETAALAEETARAELNEALADAHAQQLAALMRTGFPESLLTDEQKTLLPKAALINAWMNGTWNNSPTATSTT